MLEAQYKIPKVKNKAAVNHNVYRSSRLNNAVEPGVINNYNYFKLLLDSGNNFFSRMSEGFYKKLKEKDC